MNITLPFIFGIETSHLTIEELRFFQTHRPYGIMLFARNIIDRTQTQSLIKAIKAIHPDQPISLWIDQEGGRVQRLKPPNFPNWPEAAFFAKTYLQDPQRALQEVYENNLSIAHYLKDLDIDVNCTPVLDLPQENADKIIGDRAYGTKPDQIIALAAKVIDAHLKIGVVPVIKHMPGHGRATQDSHIALPHITESEAILKASDFHIFKEITAKYAPEQLYAMTAHLLFEQIDAALPATLSPYIIKHILRGFIGFQGKLVSDDICMHALHQIDQPITPTGTAEIAKKALNAGCDLIIHANGNLAEMEAIATIF